MGTTKIYNGDCMKLVNKITNGSIDVLITSPPYNIGKSYNEDVCLEDFIKLYLPKINKNGVFIWQVGNRVVEGFIEPIDTTTDHVFREQGFKLINRVIWHFGHGMHCRNRFSGRYEVVCIYTRNKNYTFNLDSVRVPQKYPNKKHYKGPKKGQLSSNPLGKNPSDVWGITNVKHNHPEKTKHPCQFPEELCLRLIKVFSNTGDTVCDPFMGSGTAGKVALELGRNFVGIEQKMDYFKIAEDRLNEL